jgi:MFS family permease
MYQVENSQALISARAKLLSRRGATRTVSRTVLLLGLTSLFTDISAEMVATILPFYLVYTLGLTPLQFGVVDGLYQGAATLVRVASGFIGDRWRRHRDVAAVGYGLSAVCKLGFLAVGSAWGALSALIVLDRTGKGVRTAPRDALISLSSPRTELGTAFGVHRALDTTGAMLGPLVAFGLLALAPGRFDTIFVVSFCMALVGFGILVLFVQNPAPRAREIKAPSLRSAAALLVARRFRALLVAGTVLGLATMSDGFVYLALQRRLDFDTRFFPLLYVGTALVYMVLAVPMGRLADQVGRGRVLIGGHALLLLVYASLLLPGIGPAGLVAYLLFFGAFYAATDGVLAALGSTVVPGELRGSGLAFLAACTSCSRLVASIVFGAVWTAFGLQAAIVAFALGLVLAMCVAAVALGRSKEVAVGA